jgi:hypothetical protein
MGNRGASAFAASFLSLAWLHVMLQQFKIKNFTSRSKESLWETYFTSLVSL